jgi:putative membrane protein
MEAVMLARSFAQAVHLDDFFLSLLTLQAPYDWGWRMHPMWGWGIGMMAMMLVFWAVVIFAGVAGIRWFVGQSKLPPTDSALEILRQRYARGDIDKDEFDSKKRELS